MSEHSPLNSHQLGVVRKIARKMASKSIVTEATARLIEQVLVEAHDYRIAPLQDALLETIRALEELAAHAGLSLTKNGGPAVVKAQEVANKSRRLLSVTYQP